MGRGLLPSPLGGEGERNPAHLLAQRLELQVAELDEEELRLHSDVAARQRTVVPRQSGRPVDPNAETLALRRHLVSVPFSRWIRPAGTLATDKDTIDLALDQRVAEQVAQERRLIQVRHLDLVPEFAVRRRADVDAAVVVLLALDLAEAPFDVEDAVAELVIVKQHFLDADAIAQQQVPLNLPGV